VAISILALLGGGTALAVDDNAASTSRDDWFGKVREPAPWGYREAVKVERPPENRSAETSKERQRILPLSAGDEVSGRTPATPGIGWLVLFEVTFSPRDAEM